MKKNKIITITVSVSEQRKTQIVSQSRYRNRAMYIFFTTKCAAHRYVCWDMQRPMLHQQITKMDSFQITLNIFGFLWFGWANPVWRSTDLRRILLFTIVNLRSAFIVSNLFSCLTCVEIQHHKGFTSFTIHFFTRFEICSSKLYLPTFSCIFI